MVRATYDDITRIMVWLFSSSKLIAFDLNVSDIPITVYVSIRSVVAISNVKKGFVDPQMAMIRSSLYLPLSNELS